ncbi:MAG: hypothetical protein QW483_00610 [Nanopusillaceae archaeon]
MKVLKDYNINIESEEEVEDFLEYVRETVIRAMYLIRLDFSKIDKIYRRIHFRHDFIHKTINIEDLYVKYIDDPFFIHMYHIESRLARVSEIIDKYWNNIYEIILKKADDILKEYIKKRYPRHKVLNYRIMENEAIKRVEADFIYLDKKITARLAFGEYRVYDNFDNLKNFSHVLYVNINEDNIEEEIYKYII